MIIYCCVTNYFKPPWLQTTTVLLYLIILWVRNLNRAQRRYFTSAPCGAYRSWSIQDGLFTYMSNALIRVTQMAGGWLKKFNAGHMSGALSSNWLGSSCLQELVLGLHLSMQFLSGSSHSKVGLLIGREFPQSTRANAARTS